LRSWKFKAREKVFERQIFSIVAKGASKEVQNFRGHVVEVGQVQMVLDNLRDV
jgi:hypothetical protein